MLVLIVALIAITVVCVTVGDRFGLPYPILMLLSAIGLTFVPGVSVPELDPELILQLFLPPLLFATARNTSWSVFRKRWHLLLSLAVALTALSALVTAATVWWLWPAATFPLALLIGAVVAPPDPVAVDAVSSSARIPRQLMMLLQSEGLFNDAVAIVLFQTSLMALQAGQTSIPPSVAVDFFISAIGAIVVGFFVGFCYRILDRFTTNVSAQVIVSFATPFAAYLLAEHFHASGVIAVVVTALETNRRNRVDDGETRIARTNFWEVANLLITGIAFGLIGLEMREIFRNQPIFGTDGLIAYVPVAAAVVAALFLVRFIFVFCLGLASTRQPLRELTAGATLLTWSGMRGLATLALALAVPTLNATGADFDQRRLVLIIAVTVIFVSLVPTGLSLPWLSRKLTPEAAMDTREEIAEIIRRSQTASLQAVRQEFPGDKFTTELRIILQRRFESLREELAVATLISGHEEEPRAYFDDPANQTPLTEQKHVDRMITVALDAAREQVLQARNAIDVDPALADRLLHILDQRMMVVRRQDR